MNDVLAAQISMLPQKEQRGSRVRCLLLTKGTDHQVASRLTDLSATNLTASYAIVDPAKHRWHPRGFQDTREAKLGEEADLLSADIRECLTSWWLVLRAGANTPNWDIASSCTIGKREGLLLVEAKAHANELHMDGKSAGRQENDVQIAAAISEASAALNGESADWQLTSSSCYQLCNRFAWAWKIASLGIPVVLIYLGFRKANEMSDCGEPLADAAQWQSVVLNHSRGLVPDWAWERTIDVRGTPMIPLIRSLELPLPGRKSAPSQDE
jgi:hypothetical protein